MRRPSTRLGFTLVELIIVIVITGILSMTVSSFITRPFESHLALTRRARLVNAAELTTRRMARDLRSALPNSVRVSAGAPGIELLHSVDGARYRRSPGVNSASGQDHSGAEDWLSFGGDAEFNVLGRFARVAQTYGLPLASGHRLALYSTGSSGWADAASGASPGSITPTGTTITLIDDSDEDHVLLSSPFTFRLESPRQRVYLVDGPVSYLCDLAAGTLTRISGYAPTAAQPLDPNAVPLASGSHSLVSDRVSACSFGYDPGSEERSGLVTIDLSVSEAGEQIRMLQQVHIGNAP